ncbi:MAG: TusE/DsrC/DsvC family sulfur relay protein [Xanthomonadaceae bacterium]|jgi:tRNA 2-thiouridine synthesizing protein E|nr:TusE/DsrC/DsvC family sulfur relay protein [Xanthomonadaceae bacterium]
MSGAREIAFEGRTIALDERGYLRQPDDWSEALATHLAAADGIELGPAHWEVLRFLRAYHADYGLSPPMRLLVRELSARIGGERGSSRALYRLFPEGPAKQACRYAGLPRPLSCI